MRPARARTAYACSEYLLYKEGKRRPFISVYSDSDEQSEANTISWHPSSMARWNPGQRQSPDKFFARTCPSDVATYVTEDMGEHCTRYRDDYLTKVGGNMNISRDPRRLRRMGFNLTIAAVGLKKDTQLNFIGLRHYE
jgi:hypothetical protein